MQPKKINNENIKTTLKLTVGMSTDCKTQTPFSSRKFAISKLKNRLMEKIWAIALLLFLTITFLVWKFVNGFYKKEYSKKARKT